MKRILAPILLLSFFIFSTVLAHSQQASSSSVRRIINPSIEEITDGSIPDEIVEDEREDAPNGLPDGKVETGTGDIVQAWYSEPTTRYRHGVLGDAIEAGALKVINNLGERFTFRLLSTEVFEDITPRLADLDGDGKTEVITILSSQSRGASVAIFQLNGNVLVKVAQTDFIGRANRWLNIAQIANILGTGDLDISLVVRPHLDGLLQLYRFTGDDLVRMVSTEGYTNHIIGSRELRLSAIIDADQNGTPDLVIPSLDRNELVIFGFVRNEFQELVRIALPAPIDKAIGTREVGRSTQLVVGLEDNKIYAISLQ